MFNTGNGIITRDVGRYPPNMRNLLNQIGNEPIHKITLYKYPLVELSALAKFFSNKKIPYDELFHLGMNINDKYNLDKDEVLHFVRGGIPSKSNTKTMNVDKVPTQPKLTINTLLEQTRLRIGNEKMTEYNAFRNNCQDFINNLLITGNWSTPDTIKFIHQNAQNFIKDLPQGTEIITNAITKVRSVIDKLKYGEGELTTSFVIPISDTSGTIPATPTDFIIRAPSEGMKTVFGGKSQVPYDSYSWGVDGKERPYFGNGMPTTSIFKMSGQPNYGGGGINYAESIVNPYGNEQRYNFDTAIPKRVQQYSIQNYQIRGGSLGLTYAEDYIKQPINTRTYPLF